MLPQKTPETRERIVSANEEQSERQIEIRRQARVAGGLPFLLAFLHRRNLRLWFAPSGYLPPHSFLVRFCLLSFFLSLLLLRILRFSCQEFSSSVPRRSIREERDYDPVAHGVSGEDSVTSVPFQVLGFSVLLFSLEFMLG